MGESWMGAKIRASIAKQVDAHIGDKDAIGRVLYESRADIVEEALADWLGRHQKVAPAQKVKA